MYRSFTNRVLGGVCGGIAAPLPINAWLVRLVFVVLTPVTLGAFAVLYAMLWLVVPQASPVRRGRGGASWAVLTLVLTLAVLIGWYARISGLTRTATDADLYYPVLFTALSLVFLYRQLVRNG
jgi:phage shock protein PspC (stress-responsive transcriptional regulator)